MVVILDLVLTSDVSGAHFCYKRSWKILKLEDLGPTIRVYTKNKVLLPTERGVSEVEPSSWPEGSRAIRREPYFLPRPSMYCASRQKW